MPYNTPEPPNIKDENDFACNDRSDIPDGPFRKHQKKRPRKITETYLHNSGLFYLERFAASKAHFKVVMTRKVKRSCLYHVDQNYETCVEMVDALADRFEELGLINDAIYTRGCVESFRRRGLSRAAILNKMHHKGIERAATLAILEMIDREFCKDADRAPDSIADIAERRSALKLARKKKLGPYAPVGGVDRFDEEMRQKIQKRSLGAFARAGFSYDISRWVLDMDADALDMLDIDLLM